MKPIYIYRPHAKNNKGIIIILLLLIVFVGFLLAIPFVIKSSLNKSGSDGSGYAYRVGDLDLNILKSQVRINDIKIYNLKSSLPFAEISDVKIKMNPFVLLKKEKKISVVMKNHDIIITKDLFEEMKRIKNEIKDKTKSEIYFDEVDAIFGRFNIKDLRNDNSRTILTLDDAMIRINDLEIGSVNEKTEFLVKSKIAEGGEINLSGKINPEADNNPWSIKGDLTGINAKVIEKMAGDKFPLEIKEATINARILAATSANGISGTLSPDIKNFKFVDDKQEGVIKRNIAKASNFLLKKTTEGEKEINLEIPFTLDENFTLNVQESIKKLKDNK